MGKSKSSRQKISNVKDDGVVVNDSSSSAEIHVVVALPRQGHNPKGKNGNSGEFSEKEAVTCQSNNKKRKHPEIAAFENPQKTESAVEDETKRSKKKRKKYKKKKKSTTILENQKKLEMSNNDSAANNETDIVPELEGSMVNNQLVLIDRKLGKLYSATERLGNGNRKEIGKVEANGKLCLFQDESLSSPLEVRETGAKELSVVNDVFPFETNPDDHCESPLEAYQDILPFLKLCGKEPSNLMLYDPYYCNGTVTKHLESLGFPNVYNRKEDCYHVWATKSLYPSQHDVLITNPPYSGDHVQNLIEHVTSPEYGKRPWLLLLPQWVHKKEYFISRTKHIAPFYLVPRKRYVYVPPPSFRESKKSDVHKKSSPFVSFWYIWGGTLQRNEQWLSVARASLTCDVARSKNALRDLRRKGDRKKQGRGRGNVP